MKTEVFFQEVCRRDLPDFDAVSREILAHPVPRRRMVAAIPAAVLALVLAAGVVLLPKMTRTAAPGPELSETVLSAPSEEPEKEPEAEPVQETTEEEDVIQFNEMTENQLTAALDVGLSRILLEHGQAWSLSKILDYWGFDPLPTELPEGLVAEFDETSTWKYAEADGQVWDQFSFQWGDGLDVYDPLERRLTVTVSGSEIFNCGINFFDDELLPSTIGGVEMYLGRREVSYGPYTDGPDGEKIPAGYYPLMEADFEYGGLQFQVTAENLSEEEFVAVLSSMVV